MRRLALVTFVATLAAAPALAGDTSLFVPLKDLDLNTDAGAKTALERIRKAARDACSAPPTGSRIPKLDEQCMDEAVLVAVKRLDAPRVTLAHRTRDQVNVAGRGRAL